MRKIVALALVLTAAALLSLRAYPASHRSIGLYTKIAIAVPCRPDIIPGEMVRVLKPGLVQVDEKNFTFDQLDRLLDDRLTKKVQRVVFIAAEPGLNFGDVVAAIDVAARYADYVSLITPAVERDFRSHTSFCLDPNIKFSNIIF